MTRTRSPPTPQPNPMALPVPLDPAPPKRTRTRQGTLSREGVRQIEQMAMRKFRKALINRQLQKGDLL